MNSATGRSWKTRSRSSRWKRRATSLQSRRSARGVRLPGVDEERVGVAVDQAVAALGDRRGGEPDGVLAGRRDRVRHRRREEPRRRRAEHAEERVHEDLDRLRRHLVAGAARARPLPREPRDEPRQDAGLVAPEGGAARGAERVRGGTVGDEGERVDVEGPDEARIEALEVEDEDVRVEAWHRVEDEAADDAGVVPLRRGPDRRGYPPARSELAEVERVHGGDRRPHAVDLHAGEQAPLDGQLDERRLLEDGEHEARVLEVVGGEARRLLPVRLLDVGGAVLRPEELAPA